MAHKNFVCHGMVLKRTNVGETDRVVVLLTEEMGKIACIAKGVRKLTSSRRAALEPGNLVKIYCIHSKSMPILTQAELQEDTAALRGSLTSIRQLTQLLEVADRLFVEEELDPDTYQQIIGIRHAIMNEKQSAGIVRSKLLLLVEHMGYHTLDKNDKSASVLDLVAEISERPMHSFEYLSPKSR